MATVREIIDAMGGPAKTARACDVTESAVQIWLSVGEIPDQRLAWIAARVELASDGKITRKQLFPLEWPLIWPELAS